jgi:hypothetical protein
VPSPPTAITQWWQVNSGSAFCTLSRSDRCVHDGPHDYGNSEYCAITALSSFRISMASYHVESAYDYLSVNGVAYQVSGHSMGPDGVNVVAGDVITWQSDTSVTNLGWEMCSMPVEWTGGSGRPGGGYSSFPWYFMPGPLVFLMVFAFVGCCRSRTSRRLAVHPGTAAHLHSGYHSSHSSSITSVAPARAVPLPMNAQPTTGQVVQATVVYAQPAPSSGVEMQSTPLYGPSMTGGNGGSGDGQVQMGVPIGPPIAMHHRQ